MTVRKMYCKITNYRFCKNYYFMAGDKVMNLQDSRYWGLLPEEFIVGKATFIWKSEDMQTAKNAGTEYGKR